MAPVRRSRIINNVHRDPTISSVRAMGQFSSSLVFPIWDNSFREASYLFVNSLVDQYFLTKKASHSLKARPRVRASIASETGASHPIPILPKLQKQISTTCNYNN